MSDPGFRIIEGLRPLSDADFGGEGVPNNVGVHRIGITGEWDGHNQGPFQLKKRDLESMAFYANEQASRGVEVPADYEHATLWANEAPASGWLNNGATVRELEGNGSELIGPIAWTERALGMINGKEYRYLSPTISWATTDRKSGKDVGTTLHSIALTNKPFLHELGEVRLNSIRAALAALKPEVSDMDRKELARLLGLNEDAKDEEISAAINALKGSAAGLSRVSTALGLSETAEIVEVERTALATRTAATGADDDEMKRLREENANLKLAESRRTAGALVLKHREGGAPIAAGDIGADGKPTDDSTENFKSAFEFALRDPEGFEKFMKSAPKGQTPTSERVQRPEATAAGATDKNAPRVVSAAEAAIPCDDLQSEVNSKMGLSDAEMKRIEAEQNLTVPRQ